MMQVYENEKIATRWATAMRLHGKSPTAVNVIAFEGDGSCVVEALKRTRCLGFSPLASERAHYMRARKTWHIRYVGL
jgi:hypothetical protein